jgi:hypothetical protein
VCRYVCVCVRACVRACTRARACQRERDRESFVICACLCVCVTHIHVNMCERRIMCANECVSSSAWISSTCSHTYVHDFVASRVHVCMSHVFAIHDIPANARYTQQPASPFGFSPSPKSKRTSPRSKQRLSHDDLADNLRLSLEITSLLHESRADSPWRQNPGQDATRESGGNSPLPALNAHTSWRQSSNGADSTPLEAGDNSSWWQLGSQSLRREVGADSPLPELGGKSPARRQHVESQQALRWETDVDSPLHGSGGSPQWIRSPAKFLAGKSPANSPIYALAPASRAALGRSSIDVAKESPAYKESKDRSYKESKDRPYKESTDRSYKESTDRRYKDALDPDTLRRVGAVSCPPVIGAANRLRLGPPRRLLQPPDEHVECECDVGLYIMCVCTAECVKLNVWSVCVCVCVAGFCVCLCVMYMYAEHLNTNMSCVGVLLVFTHRLYVMYM